MAKALVVVASTRAAAGQYLDQTGPIIVAQLSTWGFEVNAPSVVADGAPVRAAIESGLQAAVELIITTGGTGLSSTDQTPEMTASLLDYQIPGIAESIRNFGVANGVATAALSRGIAGVSGRTLVVNLPGSVGGVRDGLQVLAELWPHALAQLAGEDH